SNDFFDKFMELGDIVNFLQRTWLLGEVISQPVQHRIAKHLSMAHIKESELFTVEPGGLFIVRSGRVERQITKDRTIDIGVGEFFNEENVLFDAANTFNVRALENTEVWVIDAEVIGDIPVARRKLFETFLLRMQASQG
ncbi:MAG: cyclic nucleotide-binding domain-containing protein, partial [Pseudomonadota bacterium]|nr:cyclic nucleotide-binding domain-containing protein [Pseudomonadota bacterium]